MLPVIYDSNAGSFFSFPTTHYLLTVHPHSYVRHNSWTPIVLNQWIWNIDRKGWSINDFWFDDSGLTGFEKSLDFRVWLYIHLVFLLLNRQVPSFPIKHLLLTVVIFITLLPNKQHLTTMSKWYTVYTVLRPTPDIVTGLTSQGNSVIKGIREVSFSSY